MLATIASNETFMTRINAKPPSSPLSGGFTLFTKFWLEPELTSHPLSASWRTPPRAGGETKPPASPLSGGYTLASFFVLKIFAYLPNAFFAEGWDVLAAGGVAHSGGR